MQVNAADLAARFTPRRPEPWDVAEAVRLEVAADTEVEKHGSHGRHPAIQVAVGRVLKAHAEENLAGVRAACDEVAKLARELAAHKSHIGEVA